MDINTKNFLTEFCDWNEHETNFYLEVYKKIKNSDILFPKEFRDQKSYKGNEAFADVDHDWLGKKKKNRERGIILKSLDMKKYCAYHPEEPIEFTIKLNFPRNQKVEELKSNNYGYGKNRKLEKEIQDTYENKAVELVKNIFSNYEVQGYSARGFSGNVELKMISKEGKTSSENEVKKKYSSSSIPEWG